MKSIFESCIDFAPYREAAARLPRLKNYTPSLKRTRKPAASACGTHSQPEERLRIAK
jgi:hypothetical protein